MAALPHNAFHSNSEDVGRLADGKSFQPRSRANEKIASMHAISLVGKQGVKAERTSNFPYELAASPFAILIVRPWWGATSQPMSETHVDKLRLKPFLSLRCYMRPENSERLY